jgi:hypothetical protein
MPPGSEPTTSSWWGQDLPALVRRSTGLRRASLLSPSSRWPLGGMSRYLVDRIMNTENVELLVSTKVRELLGEERLEGILVEDNRSGTHRTLGVRALFVFIGAEANTCSVRNPRSE